MLLFSAEYLLSEMASYVLPFARLSGFLMTLVVVGSRNLPARFRLLLALSITVLVVPVLPATSPITLFTGESIILTIEQTLIGVALGFISRLMMETFVVGAQIIAMQSGLGFASLVDPANGTSVPALGQFFLMMTTLMFLAVDGHLMMLRLVVESFHTLPIGSSQSFLPMLYEIVLWSKWIFATALVMALVCIASLLIVNISFGVMTRAAPQINVFAVGFPLTMISGLILVWLTLVYFVPHFEGQLVKASALMCTIVGLDC